MVKDLVVTGLAFLFNYIGDSLLNRVPFWSLPYVAMFITWLCKVCLWMGLEREGGYADLATPIHQSQVMVPEKAHRILNGYNENEVTFVPKNPKKLTFFEKFFQLFS